MQIGQIDNNSLIAAAYGPGALSRQQHSASGSDGRHIPGVHDQPEDRVELSRQGESAPSSAGSRSGSTEERPRAKLGNNLTDEEEKQVRELKQRDAEVRRHEQAHKAAAGPYAKGGPSYEYSTGPDGKQYAVGGEVAIDTSEVPGNPRATIAKMQRIQRAANAPADPSSQDRAVAAQARAAEQNARAELANDQRSNGAISAESTDSIDGDTSKTAGNHANTGSSAAPYENRENENRRGALLDLIA